jgi:glycosyltransferase involved in cell wall biosynthesis
MKVLALTNLYPSTREPTRGVFNRNGFLPLARRCDLRVLAPLPWWSRLSRPGAWLRAPQETATGIPATFPTYWSVPGAPRLHGAAMYASLRAQAHRLRSEFPFDAILAAWAYPDGVAAAHLAQEFACPLVTMVLGSDINEHARSAALREQIRWGLEQAHSVIAVSHALRERVIELGIAPERVVTQHNGVDGSRFRIQDKFALRQRFGLPLDRPIVCYVGNFKPEKGVLTLVEALGRLRQAGQTELFLALVGDGELDAALRARVRALGLETQVRFCGRSPHAEVPNWIGSGDVLCLPSLREGCPNVVFEALASGRPVVASRVGGLPEMLTAENGILVPPSDPEALAAGLQRALARAWEPEALRRSVPCLSWEQFAGTLYTALAKAVQTRNERESRPVEQHAEALCSEACGGVSLPVHRKV